MSHLPCAGLIVLGEQVTSSGNSFSTLQTLLDILRTGYDIGPCADLQFKEYRNRVNKSSDDRIYLPAIKTPGDKEPPGNLNHMDKALNHQAVFLPS